MVLKHYVRMDIIIIKLKKWKQTALDFAEWMFVTTNQFTRPNLYSVVEWSTLSHKYLYTIEELFDQFLKERK